MNFFLLFFFMMGANAFEFEKEAPMLSMELKKGLISKLQDKINKSSHEEAIDFCYTNVKDISKKSAGEFLDKFKFGRTSHKIRNQENTPEEWMKSYIDQFKDKRTGGPVVHIFPDGKKAYLDPLWIAPICLNCHGENISTKLDHKIKTLYPKDLAHGFKLGEFRGFVWIKEN